MQLGRPLVGQMRIPRKKLKHVARPNPTVIPKSPTRLDALAAAAFIKLSLEIPNVPKTHVEEEDDDVLEAMEKMPALLERSIVDSDDEDPTPDPAPKPKHRKYLYNDLAKHSKFPLGATKPSKQSKYPGFEGVPNKPKKPAPKAGRSTLKQTVITNDYGFGLGYALRSKDKPKAQPKAQSKVKPKAQLKPKAQAKSKADDDSVESVYDEENLFIAATDTDHPKPPKVGEDLRQLHKEWAEYALAGMKAKSYDKAAWMSYLDSISNPQLEAYARKARTLNTKKKSSKVYYDKNKDKFLETRKLIKTACSSSDQDYLVIDVEPFVMPEANTSDSSLAMNSSPTVNSSSSPMVVEYPTLNSSPVVDSSPTATTTTVAPTLNSSPIVDSSPTMESTSTPAPDGAPVEFVGMTATVLSMPEPTDKKRKRTNKHKIKDSKLEFVINFSCMKEGHMLHLWPHKDCFDWLHRYRVKLHGEPESHRLHELRCKVAAGELQKPTFKWTKQKEPLIWSEAVITRKKNQLLKFIDEMNSFNEACWTAASSYDGALTEMQRYKWIRICRNREQRILASALSVSTR